MAQTPDDTPDGAAPAEETPAAASDAVEEAAAATTEVEAAAAQDELAGRTVSRMRTTTRAQREAAAKRAKQRRAALLKRGETPAPAGVYAPCVAPLGTPCVQVDYFTSVPNYAVSKLPVLTVSSAAGVLPVTYTATGGIRKFANTLAGLGPANANNLQNYIPIATPITNAAGTADPWGNAGDYYAIGLNDYKQQFHSDLVGPCSTAAGTAPSLIGATTCSGLPGTTGTQLRGYVDLNPSPKAAFSTGNASHFLGPVIIAQTGRPVRVKFTNNLTYTPTNPNFFLPADISYMGMTHNALNGTVTKYSQNRATLHLHGGVTPWISDGTPHQWTVPVSEYSAATYKIGDSVRLVPDMFFDATTHAPVATGGTNDPGNGSLTFFYTNAQSGRLMFYHDHAYGTTRLNVYGGEAAGFLLHDGPGTGGKTTLDDLIGAGIPSNAGLDGTTDVNLGAAIPGLTRALGGLYRFGIPLVIQDKTFVPPLTATGAALNASLGIYSAGGQLFAQDPSWNWGGEGNLWFPHVYMPNQNPNDDTGAGVAGRWDYGPWFWPPMTSASLAHGAITCLGTGDLALYGSTASCPGTLNPSGVPESFMDTPVINGVAYPTVTVPPGAYRFQVLNAANDRFFNLSWFYAADKNGNVCKPSGYTGAGLPNVAPADWTTCTEVKMVPAVPHAQSSLAFPALPPPETPGDADDTLPMCSADELHPDVNHGPGLLVTASTTAYDYNATTGLPGATRACWPSSWPTDGRDGGVPDPASAGPAWVQIGTEGGVLPAPVVIPSTPVGYTYTRRDIVVLNVQEHALFLGPAERADVIVDFSAVPSGSTLMLYSDSPAPVPGFDVRLDYYTGDPDLTDTGGAPTTQAGYGPNIRTIMQVHVVTGAGNGTTSAGYNLATLQSATGIPKVFHDTQPQIIIPEKAYSAAALGTTTIAPKDTFARIQNTTGLTFQPISGTGFGPAITQPIINKAIHELFESDYGKMNSILAAEIPITNFNNQTTIPLAYVDPPTEVVSPDQVQIWKITHNGVDSHAMHFHLFDVQLINRVGWDGAIRAADPNELGWKETVRMNPLEDAIVALRPVKPPVPAGWLIGDSVRLLDPTRDSGATNVAGLPGFTNIDPNTGDGVTTVNLSTNFGWEYVWHCHLLGHEEMDMMRPLVLRLQVPNAPTNLVATKSGNSAVLTWSWSQGTGIAATGFMVQRAPLGGVFTTIPGAASLPAAARGYTDTSAPAGTFVYKVFAINSTLGVASGPSNTSGPVTFSSALNTPGTPTISLNAATTIRVTWTDANTVGATGFALYRCTGTVAACGTPSAAAPWTNIANTGITTFSYTDRNIPVGNIVTGTRYNYAVRATGPAGATSAFSAPVTVVAN